MIVKEKKIKELNKAFSVILSIAVPVIFVVAVAIRCGMSFDTNDDFWFTRLLSGTITGKPDFHLIHVNFWIGGPLSLLYRINAGIPWWGLFLITLYVLSHAVVIYYGMRNKPERVFIVPAADLALSFAYISIAGKLQFTSIAILVAAAGYACLILEREKTSAQIWFVILEFLAYCLRSNGMLLVQPFGIIVLLGICSAEKERIKISLGKTLFTILFIFALGMLGRFVSGEMKTEWKDVYSFNKMRAEVYDYGIIPSYDELKEVLEEYHVTEEQWEVFSDYSLQEWNMDPSLSKDLLKEVKRIRKKPALSGILSNICANAVTRKEVFPALVMFVFAVIFMLLLMKLRYLRVLIGCVIAYFLCWGFLCFRGRIVDRVTIPFMFSVCLFLLFVILSMTEVGKVFEKKKAFKIFVVYAGLAGLIFVSYHTGVRPYRDIITENKTQDILTESFHELERYCEERPNEAFIIDIDSACYVYGLALKTDTKPPVNYRMSGGWFAAMPEFKESFAEYIQKESGFSFIVYDYGEERDRMEAGSAKYYESLTGSRGVLKDRIKVSSGGEFLVYRFDQVKDLPESYK